MDKPANRFRFLRWLWPRSLWGRVAVCFAVLALLVAGTAVVLRHLANTDFGRGVIVSMIDGRRVGPLGTIRLSGLEGDPLSSAKAADLAFIDENGAWMRATGIELSWSPFDLLFRRLEIERVHIETAHVFRRPVVAPRESSGGGAPDFALRLDEASIDRILIDDGVYGARASYRLSLATHIARDRAGDFALQVTPLQGMGDELAAQVSWTPTRVTEADIIAQGLPGGTLAALIQSPVGQPVSLSLQANGNLEEVEGVGALKFGERVVAQLGLTQQNQRAIATLGVDLVDWPLLADMQARIGDRAELTADIDLSDDRRAPVNLKLTSAGGDVSARGMIDIAERTFDGPIALAFENVDLARQSSTIVSGRVSGDGEANVSGLRAWSWNGDLVATDFATDTVSLERLEGLATIAMEDGEVSWQTQGADAAGFELPSVSSAPRVSLTVTSEGAYNLEDRSVRFSDTDVSGPLGGSSVAGSYNLATGELSVSGEARAAELSAISDWGGRVSGRWSVQRARADSAYEISVDGGGRDLTTSNTALASLLGSAPTLAASATWLDGRFSVQRANLRSDTVTLEMAGQTGASGGLSGSLSGRVTSRLQLPGARVDSLRISGTLTGTSAQPVAILQIADGSVLASGLDVTELSGRAIVELTEAVTAQTTLQGAVDGLPLEASFALSRSDEAIGLTDLVVSAGRLDLTAPSLAIGDGGPSGSFSLGGSVAGLGGFSAGEVAAEGVLGRDGDGMSITISGEASEVVRPGVDLRRATFDATVRSDALQLNTVLEGRGDSGPRLMLEINGEQDAGVWSGSALVDGEAGAYPISMSQPAAWSFGPDGYSFSGAADLLAGNISADLSSSPEASALNAQLSGVELRALTRLVQLSPVVGEVSGSVSLQAAADAARTGQFDLDISGLNPLGADIAPLNLNLRGDLANGVLRMVTTGSGGEFSIDGAAEFATLGTGLMIELDRTAPFTASLDMEGRAEQFWTLARQEDQALSGALAINLTARGEIESPELAGGFRLDEAAYDHGESGFHLEDVSLTGVFDQRSVELTSVSGVDGRGGRLSGTGRLDWSGDLNGGIEFEASSLHALNREDRSAVVSGSGAVTVEPAAVLISGDMDIETARFSVEQPASARIPTLNSVRRVNFPGREDSARVAAPRRPIRLDLKVEAPRRVFVFGRGLDMEWATDFDVTGSIANPIVDGRATLVRGDLNLAGRRFPFDGGAITLDGPIRSARIDITATGNAASTEARVRLVGTPVSPEFVLESSPALPQDEILSRLIFGRSAAELSALETAQLAAALAQLAGGQAAFDPAGVLREATGLDRISIGAEGDTASIAAGKYIAEDVFLQVGAGGEGGAAAEVEWEPIDNLSVTSSARGNGDTRMTVRWKKDY